MLNHNKFIIFFFFQITYLCAYSQSANKIGGIKTADSIDIQKCIGLLEGGKKFWINDSLGTTGYRMLLTIEFLKKCPFENIKWGEVSDYFGKPNSIWEENNVVDYNYLVLRGFYWLRITLKDGKISKFKFVVVDG